MIEHQEHLGDGVYVGWDGYSILLCANDHENLTRDAVCLDPYVLRAFDRYREKLKAELRKKGGGQ